MRRARFVPLLAALLLFWGGSAKAARSAYVIGNGSGAAPVLQSTPSSGAPPLATLRVGDPIFVSNSPTNGYYKARISTGRIGWISADSVSPPPMVVPPQEEGTQGDPIPYTDVQSQEPQEKTAEPSEAEPADSSELPFQLQAFGGIQLLNTTITFSQIGVSLYSSLPYFGVEFGIPLKERIYLVFRLEHLSKSSSQAGYDFSLSATPLTTGLSYSFLPSTSAVKLRGALLVGVALGTTLEATATGDPSPNISELQTQAFTEMVKGDLEIPISSSFSLFAEGGFRFLDSASLAPSTNINGSAIFQENGTVNPIPLSLSGLFGGAGLALYL